MNKLAATTLPALALTLGFASKASAEVTYNETVVHNTTTSVEITLDNSTVLCSAADYGALFLKILIPQLGKLTLLDHQNTGAGAPCVASGSCEPGNEPSDIINPADKTEVVAINVKAIRVDEADSVAQTCNTSLTERVQVTIRGKDFFHERWATLGTRPFSDCVTSSVVEPEPEPEPEPETGSGGTKTDTYGAPDPDGGGCSTGGGSSIGALFAVAGVLGARRRRARR